MKKTKLLSLLLAVILLAGCAPLNGITGAARVGLPLAQRANAAGEGIPGDVDGDGAVTPADARFVLRAAVGLDDSDMVLDMTLGDVDGEEGITPADARLILRAAVGLESLSGGDGPQTGSDFLFIPEESAVAFDEAETVLFYNNFINVYLLSALDAAEEQSLAALVGGTVAGRLTGSVELLQIQVPETSLADLKEKCETLMRNDAVLWATYDVPNEIAPMRADSDPWSGNPDEPESDRNNEASPGGRDWWAEAIHAYSAWDKTDELDSKIKVGVIDDGFYDEHPDLEGRITMSTDYPTNTPSNHGTHVSGLIAARNNTIGMRGVCKDAELICVDYKPSENRNLLTTGEYISITANLIESGAQIINNSWGNWVLSEGGFVQQCKGYNVNIFANIWNKYQVNYDDYLVAKYNDAKLDAMKSIMLIGALLMKETNPDFLIVQACGNGYSQYNEKGELGNIDKGFEAFMNAGYCSITEELFNEVCNLPSVKKRFEKANINYSTITDHIIRVGAVEKSSRNYKMAPFSNYGTDFVDICAPGVDVYSTVYDASQENPYTYASKPGTSMAAPIVAGSAALVWGLNPALKAAEVKEILLSTANTNVRGVGDDRNSTYRMVNLDAAVDRVINQTYFDLWSHVNELYCNLTFRPLESGMLDKDQKISVEYSTYTMDYYRLTDQGAEAIREIGNYFPQADNGFFYPENQYMERDGVKYVAVTGIGSDFWETRSVKLISKSGNNAVLGISGVGYDMQTGSGWSDNVVTNPQNIVFEDGRWLFTGDHFDYDY